MSYDLTDRQMDLVKWIVGQVRKGDLPEEFLIAWFQQGGGKGYVICDYREDQTNLPEITPGSLDALHASGMLLCDIRYKTTRSGRSYESSRRCVVRKKAYDAVDSEFETSDVNDVSKESETKVDETLRRLKNHPVAASIIVLGVVIIALAEFTGSVSALAKFASDLLPRSTSVVVRYTIENNTDAPIEIDRFSSYYIGAPPAVLSPFVEPTGRLLLEPTESVPADENYVILPGGSKSYDARFPIDSGYKNQLMRGGANIHFVIKSEASDYASYITVPFHEEAIRKLSLHYRIETSDVQSSH